jgi:tetratricopeptide (TPR) repeat protein
VLRKALSLVLALGLLGIPSPTAAQSVPTDPDVAKGVRQVDEGDYDAAIVTLDAASRRLAGDPARVRDLSAAYLYLGIAYVAKGHEAAAKAKFRDAVRQIKDLVLSTDKYPPKVIDLFEAAREEVNRAVAAEPAIAPSPAARTSPAPAKSGGPSKALIIGGVLLAGGGAAVALAGGGGGGGSSSTPADTRNSQVFTGNLPSQDIRGFTVTASKAGTLEATLTWQDRSISLTIDCQEKSPPYTQCGHSNRTTDTSALLTTPVTQKEYDIIVNNFSDRAGAEPFTLTVRYP